MERKFTGTLPYIYVKYIFNNLHEKHTFNRKNERNKCKLYTLGFLDNILIMYDYYMTNILTALRIDHIILSFKI
jgi:hypothetical protein